MVDATNQANPADWHHARAMAHVGAAIHRHAGTRPEHLPPELRDALDGPLARRYYDLLEKGDQAQGDQQLKVVLAHVLGLTHYAAERARAGGKPVPPLLAQVESGLTFALTGQLSGTLGPTGLPPAAPAPTPAVAPDATATPPTDGQPPPTQTVAPADQPAPAPTAAPDNPAPAPTLPYEAPASGANPVPADAPPAPAGDQPPPPDGAV